MKQADIQHISYGLWFSPDVTTFINHAILAEDPRDATRVINEQEGEGEEDENYQEGRGKDEESENNQTSREDIDEKEDWKASGEEDEKKQQKMKSKKDKNYPKAFEGFEHKRAEGKGDEKGKREGKSKNEKLGTKRTKDTKATKKEYLNETEVDKKSKKSKIAPRAFPKCSTYKGARGESCCMTKRGGCNEDEGGCLLDSHCKGDLVCWGQGSCTHKLKEVGILVQDNTKHWSCCTKPGGVEPKEQTF